MVMNERTEFTRRDAQRELRNVPTAVVVQALQMMWLGKMFKMGERILKAIEPNAK